MAAMDTLTFSNELSTIPLGYSLFCFRFLFFCFLTTLLIALYRTAVDLLGASISFSSLFHHYFFPLKYRYIHVIGRRNKVLENHFDPLSNTRTCTKQ